MKISPKHLVLAFPLLLAGCTLHPEYSRPAVDIPGIYRGEAAQETQTTSLGDEKWSEVFQDKELQGLILIALQQNYDVPIAASRIVQAQAQLGITRADQFPTVAGDAGATTLRSAQNKLQPAYQLNA
jgi:multidrug efflux system outer membrane protein